MSRNSDYERCQPINLELEMLRFYQEEWLFRVAHFWRLVVRFTTINLIITFAPLLTGPFKGEIFGGRWAYMFPILGMFFALISRWIIAQEARRQDRVQVARNAMAEKMPGGDLYCKITYPKRKKFTKIYNKPLKYALPIIMTVFQFVAAIFSLILIDPAVPVKLIHTIF